MKWNINDVVHGFKVKRMERVQEVASDVYELEHVQSGARLLYLDSKDDNKVFYICFRTTSDNSKGTPPCIRWPVAMIRIFITLWMSILTPHFIQTA